jgi:hypothetical protein
LTPVVVETPVVGVIEIKQTVKSKNAVSAADSFTQKEKC